MTRTGMRNTIPFGMSTGKKTAPGGEQTADGLKSFR